MSHPLALGSKCHPWSGKKVAMSCENNHFHLHHGTSSAIWCYDSAAKRHIPVLDSVLHGPWCDEVSIHEETFSTVERHQRTIDCPFVECVPSMDEIVRMTLIHQQDHLLIKCHEKRAEPSIPIDEHTPKPIVHETTPTTVSV